MSKILSVRRDDVLTGDLNETKESLNPSHFFPFQGHTIDIVKGLMPTQHTESFVNLLDTDRWNWRVASNLGTTESDTFKWDEKYQAWKITGYRAFYMPSSIAIPIVRSRQYFMEIEVLRENNEGKLFYWGGCRYDANRSYLAGYGGTYDYSCASAVTPTVGVWTTYKRYYKTGESASSSGWGTDTEFYAIGGLVNYSGTNTQVTYIRNIKFGYIDEDNSNGVLSSDGLELDKAKTNLVENETWTPSRTMGVKKVYQIPFEGLDSPPDKSANVYVIDKNSNASTWSGNAYLYAGKMSLSISAGQSRTLSMWVYVSKDCNINSVWAYLEGSASGSKYYNLNEKGTWQKLEVTAVASADGTYNALFFCMLSGVTDFSTLTGFIAFSHFQLESDRFSSSVLNAGTTRGETGLTIPNLNYQTFSINFDFKPKHLYYKDDSVSSYNVDILDFKDTSTGLHVSYSGYHGSPGPSQTNDAPFLDPEPNASWGVVSNWHMHHYIGYEKNKWYNVTIAKSGSAFYVRWIDKETGTVLINSTFNAPTSEAETITSNFAMRELHIGGGYGDIWRGSLRNLSIFNRLLTLDESKIMATGTKIQSSGFGRIFLAEKTPYPSNGLYFPLEHSTASFDGLVTPIADTNALKLDGQVFVGNAYTNLADNAYRGGWQNSGTGVRAQDTWVPRLFTDLPVHDFFATSDGDGCILTGQTSSAASTQYTASIWVWLNVPPGSTATPLYVREYRTSGNGFIANFSYNGSTDVSTWPQRQWLRVSTNITTSSDSTTLYFCIYLGSNKTDVHLTGSSIVQTYYDIPLVYGATADSYLTYNIKNAYGIDWDNGPWTIMYWTKPVKTHSGLTGYNLCSVGSNSTSGYFYFGKQYNTNAFIMYVKSVGMVYSATFTASDFFENWYFTAVRNDGTNIKLTTFGKFGVRTASVAKPSSTLVYERSGRDLEMGGWDNSGRSNSIYKDLFITKTALTDTEIENIYKTMVKLKRDSVDLHRNIKEVL